MKKCFRLFHRPWGQLTRETMGTGIGVAPVRQMAGTIGARAVLANREPGAELSPALPREEKTRA
jgi:two-component system phosphate regulon sensor histidine kinase PhoR